MCFCALKPSYLLLADLLRFELSQSTLEVDVERFLLLVPTKMAFPCALKLATLVLVSEIPSWNIYLIQQICFFYFRSGIWLHSRSIHSKNLDVKQNSCATDDCCGFECKKVNFFFISHSEERFIFAFFSQCTSFEEPGGSLPTNQHQQVMSECMDE